MYNEAATVSDYQVKVETATHAEDEPNPFYERICQLVDPSRDPWKTFSEIVFSAVPMRFQNLKYHIAGSIDDSNNFPFSQWRSVWDTL